MSIVKLASDRHPGIISNFTRHHPLLTAGIALTGGIAAADAGVSAYNAIRSEGKQSLTSGIKQLKTNSALRQTVKEKTLHGLGQGALYGGILSAVEPAILHGALRKKEE